MLTGTVRSRPAARDWWRRDCWAGTSRQFVGGGALPSGIITHPDPLSAEQAAGLQEQWVNARMSTMGLPAVLSGGVEFTPTQQSPAEMGVVELAQMTESRIAVLLRVPPFLMGLPSGGD